MFARKDLNLEWLEIAGQARNDGDCMVRNDGGRDAAGAEPPPYGGVGRGPRAAT